MTNQATDLETLSRQKAYLDAMGIQVWLERHPVTADADAALPQQAASESAAGMDWDALERCVSKCTACDLHKSRRQTVFGTGDRHADWLIIGEAPGDMEDRQGEPFVGPAGKLLNQMLLSVGQQRASVFIANILKCRPPGNRDPQPEEVAHCHGYLQRQIELLQPNMVLAVGRIAAHNLLGVTTPIGKLRGRVYTLEPFGIPLVVTYHPAYLLRSPLAKREAWKDLCLAQRTCLEASC